MAVGNKLFYFISAGNNSIVINFGWLLYLCCVLLQKAKFSVIILAPVVKGGGERSILQWPQNLVLLGHEAL